MVNFFLLTFFLSIFTLIAGLVKPEIFKNIIKIIPKRKTIVFACIGIMIVSFIGVGIFAPPVEKNKDVSAVTNNIEKPVVPQVITTTTIETVVTSTEPEPIVNNSDNKEVIPVVEVKSTQSEKTTPTPVVTTPTKPQYEFYSVSSIVDGDTIKVSINGTIETLRLIGMDTPETVDPRKPVQCFGKEASDKAKELLIGKKVRLEIDSTQGEFDKYNRRLAYIYREDGLFYNKHMIEQGYAYEYTYITPYKYQTEFKTAQQSAKDNLRGLWSPNTCNGSTTLVVTATTTTQITTPQQIEQSPVTQTSSPKWYTSSYYSSKNYYCEADPGWKTLSTKYLKTFNSEQELLAAYPNRILKCN